MSQHEGAGAGPSYRLPATMSAPALATPISDKPPRFKRFLPNVTPTQTVVTREELNPKPIVSSTGSPITALGQDAVETNRLTTGTDQSGAISRRQHGEEIVAANGKPLDQ